MTEPTGTLKAAAFHGTAINKAYPTELRLQAALEALEIYEAEAEQLQERASLTRDERALVTSIAKVYNEFCRIMPRGTARHNDLLEVVFHIHGLQRMIMANAAARAYPDQFRPLGGDEPKDTERHANEAQDPVGDGR